jgi:Mg-chelatase subunit ChlD
MISKSMCRAWMFGPVLSLSVTLASCSGPVPNGVNTNGGGSQTGSVSGTGTGPVINVNPGATSTSVSTGTEVTEQESCGVVTNDATKQADILLVLDRSGSMDWAMNSNNTCQTGGRRDTTCQARWPTMKTALAQVLASPAGGMSWGLKFFSSPNQNDECGVAAGVDVPAAAGNAAAINNKINSVSPSGRTPTREAVKKATDYLKGLTGPEPKSILLATDGQPNCKEGEADTAIEDIEATTAAIRAAHDAGFKVYILGIGPEASVVALNGFADAGGTKVENVSGAGKNYYAAMSAEEMSKQFDSIVGSVASCTFTLKSAPPVVDNIAVEFDGNKSQRAPRSSTNGWEYSAADHKTIQLYGAWCDNLMNGTYKSAKVLFGCAGQIIP